MRGCRMEVLKPAHRQGSGSSGTELTGQCNYDSRFEEEESGDDDDDHDDGHVGAEDGDVDAAVVLLLMECRCFCCCGCCRRHCCVLCAVRHLDVAPDLVSSQLSHAKRHCALCRPLNPFVSRLKSSLELAARPGVTNDRQWVDTVSLLLEVTTAFSMSVTCLDCTQAVNLSRGRLLFAS